MNKFIKLLLYPTSATLIIVLMTCLDWLLTAFFSAIFDVEMKILANSPIIIFYVLSFLGSCYIIITCFQYIDEEL
jgi:hypothetical protein